MIASAVMVRMAIGGHEVVQDGELLTLTFHGPLTLAQVTEVRARVDELLRVGRCFVLADMTALTTIEAAARRYIGEWGRSTEVHLNGAAIVGTSFAVRVMMTLMLNAIRVLARHQVPTVFVRDEAEARAWIAERQRLLT